MRISDWSSDVCSSDLLRGDVRIPHPADAVVATAAAVVIHRLQNASHDALLPLKAGASDRRHGYVATVRRGCDDRNERSVRGGARGRSEEHTSELPSLMRISYAVFCWKKIKQIS